jgi:uncharacterized repeat protein (TIGR02543 family)
MNKRIVSTALVFLTCLCTLSFPAFAASPEAPEPTAAARYSNGAVSISGTGYKSSTDYIVRIVNTAKSSLSAMTQTTANGSGAIFVSVTTGKLEKLSDYTAYVNNKDGSQAAAASIEGASPVTYTAAIAAGTGGSITTGTTGSYAAGTVISLKATANSNYTFDKWTSSNGGKFANARSAATTFTMPANSVTVTAHFTYNGGGGDHHHSDGGSHHHNGGGSGSGTTATAPVSSSNNTFASDTNHDFSVNGTYQFKITSKDGKAPVFAVGTSGVFQVTLAKVDGNDYFYKITAIGAPGSQAGIYINHGPRLLIATVGSAFTSGVKLDTGSRLSVAKGRTYQFRVTASSKPVFVCGNSSVFRVSFSGSKGNDYFFKVTATGKAGDSAGFYINREKAPRTIGTIA